MRTESRSLLGVSGFFGGSDVFSCAFHFHFCALTKKMLINQLSEYII